MQRVWAPACGYLGRAALQPQLLRGCLEKPQHSFTAAASMGTSAALVYDRHGEPSEVLKLTEQQLPDLRDSDIQVEVLLVREVKQHCFGYVQHDS